MNSVSRLCVLGCLLVLSCSVILVSAWGTENNVLGQVDLVGATKVERTSGVWIDGQYVGYLRELKGSKKILLLPGEHDITVRQGGYLDFTQKVTVRAGETQTVEVNHRHRRIFFDRVMGGVRRRRRIETTVFSLLSGRADGLDHQHGSVAGRRAPARNRICGNDVPLRRAVRPGGCRRRVVFDCANDPRLHRRPVFAGTNMERNVEGRARRSC